MLKLFFLGIIFLWPFYCWGEVRSFGDPQSIIDKVKQLKDLPAENFFKEVDEYRLALENYFDRKKRICDGEFSTVLLKQDEGEKVVQKRIRLTRSERKLCFRELKALQVAFVNNMFVARKRYLNYLHKKRLEDLTLSKENAIKSLHSSFIN